MKKIFVRTSIAFLLLPLMGTGCEKEDDVLWELSPESKNPVIHKEVDGIEFKFCLLNEQGEPATTLNEGDNFSFFFSVTNNRKEKLIFDPGFAYSKEVDFCRVYNIETQNMGRPYQLITALDIGSGAYPFNTGKIYVFKEPWIDQQNSVWYWENGTYESTHREPLTKGNYYTGFKYRFRFARNHEESALYTDTLNFKINFKIQ